MATQIKKGLLVPCLITSLVSHGPRVFVLIDDDAETTHEVWARREEVVLEKQPLTNNPLKGWVLSEVQSRRNGLFELHINDAGGQTIVWIEQDRCLNPEATS